MPEIDEEAAKKKLLIALRVGSSRTGAAAAYRINRKLMDKWMADPEFAAAVEEAEGLFEAWTVGLLRRAGEEAEVIETFDSKGNLVRRTKKYEWRAMAWLLEHHPRLAPLWATAPRLEISGPEGGPLQLAGAVSFHPDPEWLAKYVAALAELPTEVGRPMIVEEEVLGLGPGESPVRAPEALVEGSEAPEEALQDDDQEP